MRNQGLVADLQTIDEFTIGASRSESDRDLPKNSGLTAALPCEPTSTGVLTNSGSAGSGAPNGCSSGDGRPPAGGGAVSAARAAVGASVAGTAGEVAGFTSPA